MIAVGDQAPDFTLHNQNGEPVSLSAVRGRPVVVIFFPFAFSPLCTGELCAVQDRLDLLEDHGVLVLAVCCDGRFALDAFARTESFDFDLLSDFWPHGEVARAFGVLDEAGGYPRRHTFVLDGRGVVVDEFGTEDLEARSGERFEAALATLNGR